MTRPKEYYELLSATPSIKGSTRCGKQNCPFYDKDNIVSKCSLFDDRRKCKKSNKQRRAAKKASKQRIAANWFNF